MAVYSGLFNGIHGEDYALLVNKSSLRKRLSLLFRQRGNGVLKEKLLTLLADSTPASTASLTRTRVQARQGLSANLGGVVPIESASLINTAVVAGDVTDMNSILNETRIPTYPTDPSGNTGGGKAGY